MTTLRGRARLLAQQIQALHTGGKSYRQITREYFPGVAPGTLNRIAKSDGNWLPKDRAILKALGLVESREPAPEWVRPVRQAIRKWSAGRIRMIRIGKDRYEVSYTIFEITDTEKPQVLRVKLVSATEMSFDISFAGKDYEEVIKDICEVAPAMMSYDADLMEAFDDAFRTQPKQSYKINIRNFIEKYRGALSGLDIDFLEGE